MPKNISGVPAGRSVFHLTSPLIGLLNTILGWLDSSSNPHVLRCFLRPSLTEAPSLDRSYPASLVLRASPSPQTAQPDSHELPVDRDLRSPLGFPVLQLVPFFCLHAVAITPAGSMDPVRSYCFHQRRPSPITRWVGSCVTCFEACSAFTHVTAYMLAKSP